MSKPEMIGDFVVPKWWECQWRRITCNKPSCKFCGRIICDRERHIKKGDDPDSWEAVFEDMKRNFQETAMLIRKGAKKWGIDIDELANDPVDYKAPPSPSRFPLYKNVFAWRKRAYEIAFIIQQEFEGATSDALEDIRWYANLLPTKVYRQLCTKWEMKHQPAMYSNVDHVYTRYILHEITTTLKRAIGDLAEVSNAQKIELLLLLSKLGVLEPRILTL